ncbi:hypothetical protein ACFE04_007720 [Oxalis oulophora]
MESTPIKKPKLTKDQLGTFLSDYLIFDILVNLPVKSIVCFRGLSKFWHSQLYSPLFIKDRLRLSKSDEGLEKLRMIIIYPFHCLKSCSLYSLYHEPYGYSVYLNFPMKDFRKGVHLVGLCNELVCFYVEQKRITHHLFVWNPCIGEWRYLPTSEGYHWDSDFGFGYSDTVDDYKVVKVVTQEGKLGRSEVFSWATDSWKKIDDFPGVGPHNMVNGVSLFEMFSFRNSRIYIHYKEEATLLLSSGNRL